MGKSLADLLKAMALTGSSGTTGLAERCTRVVYRRPTTQLLQSSVDPEHF